MHRESLLKELADYAPRYPNEQRIVEQFVAFVAGNVRCFERDCWTGHITGSTWLVNPAQSHLLLTHHKKLDKWLQLGGHSDGDPDTKAVALREGVEESGLELTMHPQWPELFDIDVHEIPARKADPPHFHFDLRYVLLCEGNDSYSVSDESHDLSWVEIEALEDYTQEVSILRMREKWRARNFTDSV